MNGKVSKLLRKMRGNDKRSKRLWRLLTPNQRGKVRAAYTTNPDNPAEAVAIMYEELSGRKVER
ncbi:MAG: hypothetical protein ACXADH_12795 [Candidatus Kariarchaeaceae archaeon]|jgi:hypothetical protein